MLEAHHYNTYGIDSSSTSSTEDSCEEISSPPANEAPCDANEGANTAAAKHPDDLEDSMHGATSIINKHKHFLHEQQLQADHHVDGAVRLPRTVASRPCTGGAVAMATKNSTQRKVSQAEKNRKRKLKKRKAKEKRPKLVASNT